MKRELLDSRKKKLHIQEKMRLLGIDKNEEKTLTEQEKNILCANDEDDIDELIHKKWGTNNPNINDVENVIENHR